MAFFTNLNTSWKSFVNKVRTGRSVPYWTDYLHEACKEK